MKSCVSSRNWVWVVGRPVALLCLLEYSLLCVYVGLYNGNNTVSLWAKCHAIPSCTHTNLFSMEELMYTRTYLKWHLVSLWRFMYMKSLLLLQIALCHLCWWYSVEKIIFNMKSVIHNWLSVLHSYSLSSVT